MPVGGGEKFALKSFLNDGEEKKCADEIGEKLRQRERRARSVDGRKEEDSAANRGLERARLRVPSA